MEFLWEFISEDHHKTINPNLVSIFEASSSQDTINQYPGYGWWTKRIDCYGSTLNHNRIRNIARLLDQCPNLSIFALCKWEVSTANQRAILHALSTRYSNSLRRLDLHPYDLPPAPPLPLTAFRLNSLDIVPRGGDVHISQECLETITTLTLRFSFNHPESDLLPGWYLPRLTTLSMYYVTQDAHRFLSPFLEMHQNTLRHLYISVVRNWHRLEEIIPHTMHLTSLTLAELDFLDLIAVSVNQMVLHGVTHLGLETSGLDSSEVSRSALAALEWVLRGRSCPDVRVVGLKGYHGRLPMNWTATVWELAQRGVNMEDGFGRPLYCET